MQAIAVVRGRCAVALLAAVLPAWDALHATPDSLYMRMGGDAPPSRGLARTQSTVGVAGPIKHDIVNVPASKATSAEP